MKKNLYLEKNGTMELRNRNFSTAFCYHFSHVSHVIHIFSHVQNACFSHFSPSAFSKHIFFACSFTFFTIMWRNVKKEKTFWTCAWKQWKNAFWKCTWKKCEKMRKKHLNIQLGRWSFDFLGSSFAAVTLLPAQVLQVENPRGAVQINRKWTV